MTSPNPSFSGGELLRIDVSGWADGIYIVTVADDDGNRYSERLVVQH